MSIRPVALVALLTACSAEPPPGDPFVCGETFKDIPMPVSRNIDILFVIDTAPTMAGEQVNLASNYRMFANVLESIEGGLPDVHIGVVTANLGAGGFEVAGCSGDGDGARFHAPAECGVDGPFLIDNEYLDGTREWNYTGELADAFVCLASVPVGTCEFSQPIAAAVTALQNAPAGFLRDEAFLAIIFITDSDDCSAADPALFDPARTDLGPVTPFRCFEQGVVCDPDEPRLIGEKRGCAARLDGLLGSLDVPVSALRQLKSDPALLIVSIVAGNEDPVVVTVDPQDRFALEPSCSTAVGEARPAVRLRELGQRFQRNSATTVCNGDLSDALILFAGFGHVVGNPCIEGDIDRDPDTAGVQAECAVSDVRYPGTDLQEETIIPACSAVPPPADERPCWHIEIDPTTCPSTDTQAMLKVERHDYPPTGTHVQVRCRILC